MLAGTQDYPRASPIPKLRSHRSLLVHPTSRRCVTQPRIGVPDLLVVTMSVPLFRSGRSIHAMIDLCMNLVVLSSGTHGGASVDDT